jgi:hypothetical protein
MSKSTQTRYWNLSTIVGQDPDGAEALRHSDYLNAKVGAFLTHVSLMAMATLWFVTYTRSVNLGAERPEITDIVNKSLAVELLAYVAVTIMCLRAIWVASPSTFRKVLKGDEIEFSEYEIEQAVAIFLREVTIRKSFFMHGLRLTILTTVAFVVSFIVKFSVYSPN